MQNLGGGPMERARVITPPETAPAPAPAASPSPAAAQNGTSTVPDAAPHLPSFRQHGRGRSTSGSSSSSTSASSPACGSEASEPAWVGGAGGPRKSYGGQMIQVVNREQHLVITEGLAASNSLNASRRLSKRVMASDKACHLQFLPSQVSRQTKVSRVTILGSKVSLDLPERGARARGRSAVR